MKLAIEYLLIFYTERWALLAPSSHSKRYINKPCSGIPRNYIANSRTIVWLPLSRQAFENYASWFKTVPVQWRLRSFLYYFFFLVSPSTTISSLFKKKGCSLWLPLVLDNSERLLNQVCLTRCHSLLMQFKFKLENWCKMATYIFTFCAKSICGY